MSWFELIVVSVLCGMVSGEVAAWVLFTYLAARYLDRW